jgi:hypothetical protein
MEDQAKQMMGTYNVSNINMASIEKQRNGYSQKLQSFELNTIIKMLRPLTCQQLKIKKGLWVCDEIT